MEQNKVQKKRLGFTLLELIVVTLAIAILAAITIPSYNAVKNNARDNTTQLNLNTVARDAAAIYNLNQGVMSWKAALATAQSETAYGKPDMAVAPGSKVLCLPR